MKCLHKTKGDSNVSRSEFRRFDHFRIRTLLYTGKPNWQLLDTINPAEVR
jgi:hypothetical protein